MYLLSVLVSFFGLFGLVRSMRVLISAHFTQLFSNSWILFATFGTHFFLNMLFRHHFWLQISLNMACFLIGPLIIQIQDWFRCRHSDEKLLAILDLLIVRVSSGSSFRQSLQYVQAGSAHFNHLMKEIVHAITTHSSLLDYKHQRLSHRTITELQSIDKSSFKTLERLRNLRENLRLQLQFKRKVQQASLQVRLQTGILCLIYTGLVILSFIYFDRSSLVHWLGSSLVLFMIGSAFSWKMARSFKWKI